MHSSRTEEIEQESAPKKKPKNIYRPRQKMLWQQRSVINLCLKKAMLRSPDREAINDLFENYLEHYKTKNIRYIHSNEDSQPIFTEGPCRTRFTDRGRHIKELINYQNCWNNASRLFDTGVVIGLTTNPRQFDNIYHANKHFGNEINRFLTNISYHIPKPKYYYCAYEFTKTGILHAHLAIFGIPYLHSADVEQEEAWIRQRWSCQGKRVNSDEIRKDPHWGIWYRVKKDNRTDPMQIPIDNTREYLGKGLVHQLNSELYWTFDTKYFTNSKNLLKV